MIPIPLFNQLLALSTIAMQVIAVVLILSLLTYTKIHYAKTLVDIVGKYAIWFAAFVALSATSGSLFYSEIVQFEPCTLCWYQRILMYPQVILLGIALIKKDNKIGDYIIGLSLVGGAISVYQYFIQMTHVVSVFCSGAEGATSCNAIYLLEYGYITIPLMSFTVFSLLILIILAQKTGKKI